MGFDVHFMTTEKISPALQSEIIADANKLYLKHNWNGCSGPDIENESGFLAGCSRLTAIPQNEGVDEEAADQNSELPAGTIYDLLDAFCHLSGHYGFDWQVSHDHSDGPIGNIIHGVADDELREAFICLEAMLQLMDRDQDERE